MERLYTVSEVAELVGCSVGTLQRWDKEGRIKAHRNARNRRVFTESQVREMLSLSDQDGTVSAGAEIEKSYSVTQAAKYLGISVRTLQEWDRNGRVKAYRNPAHQRVYKESQLQEIRANIQGIKEE